jgi:hypothetical protein
MRKTDDGPLPLYLLQSTQEKLTEAARQFDLPKHGSITVLRVE